jgi:hypothetical protein
MPRPALPLVLGLFAGLLAPSAGCASIFSGSQQNIFIASSPPMATILVNGAPMGNTPATVRLARSGHYTVTINLPGYQPYQMTLQREVNGWFFANLILGGLVGMIIDAATGAMWTLSPTTVSTGLAPSGYPPPGSAPPYAPPPPAYPESSRKGPQDLRIHVVLTPQEVRRLAGNATLVRVGQLRRL